MDFRPRLIWSLALSLFAIFFSLSCGAAVSFASTDSIDYVATAHAAWQNCVPCRLVPPHRRLRPRRNPHSCGTTAVPNPRFPALALFGRRPSESVERPSSRQPKTYTGADFAASGTRTVRHDGPGSQGSMRVTVADAPPIHTVVLKRC